MAEDTHAPSAAATPYEATLAALHGRPAVPDLVLLDADHVLWPCSCRSLAPAVTAHADAVAVVSALHAAGVRVALIASPVAEGAGDALAAQLDEAVRRAGLAGVIKLVHVPGDAQPPLQPGQEQAATEAHWRAFRGAGGMASWSSCLAVVGSAQSQRAANRVGVAVVLARGAAGLTAEHVRSGLEVWEAKAEGDRGF